MSHTKNIEIYKLIANFNSPLANDPTKCSNSGIGDFLVIIDETVWIKQWTDGYPNEFVRVIYDANFVRINPSIFEIQSKFRL